MQFLTDEMVRDLQRDIGTPFYVYDQATLETAAQAVLNFPNAYGLTARYAMKALPTAAVLRIFDAAGLHIDASSGFEAERAMLAGIAPEKIQITAQELPGNLKGLVEQGVLFNACSLQQLRAFGELFLGAEVSVRVNPGLGSGHNNRTNVGGPLSSFGIWHEHLDEVFALQEEFGLQLTGLHSHIGSGGDPDVWRRCAQLTLAIVERMPKVIWVSLGGGFKVERMAGESCMDLTEIGTAIQGDFEAFRAKHGRKLRLEIEPGSYLTANAGAIVATVTDVVDTGTKDYAFVKIDSGMSEILRPSMYGAQHPITVVPKDPDASRDEAAFVVVGHCCETGDVLTPEPGNPEGLEARTLCRPAIGDAVVIEGAGAYCSAQSAKNYNSFPEAPEVLLDRDGAARIIRERQSIDQIIENERT